LRHCWEAETNVTGAPITSAAGPTMMSDAKKIWMIPDSES